MHLGRPLKRNRQLRKIKKTGDTKVEGDAPEVQSGFVAAEGSIPVNSSKKRRVEDEENDCESTKKTKTAQMILASTDSSSPSGLIWDGENYRCAYDALFTVLFEIWSSDTRLWTRRFKEINQHHLKSLSAGFKRYFNGQTSFETARDTIRHQIYSQNPEQFPYGTRGTSVAALTAVIFAPNDCVAISSPECTSCEYSEPTMNDRLEFILYGGGKTSKSTSHWLCSLEHEIHEECPDCHCALKQPISFKSAPSVLVFEINSTKIKISKTLKFVQDSETVILEVRGLIYHGDFHFTSHIIGNDNNVWYHDGMTTGSTCKSEGDFDIFSTKKLLKCRGKRLILVVYARV